jgi:hypothetical protein
MNFLRKLSSTKLWITFLITCGAFIFRKLDLITGDQMISLLQVIIPSFMASNVVASHSAFQQDHSKVPDNR